jgi:hypothetical protein
MSFILLPLFRCSAMPLKVGEEFGSDMPRVQFVLHVCCFVTQTSFRLDRCDVPLAIRQLNWNFSRFAVVVYFAVFMALLRCRSAVQFIRYVAHSRSRISLEQLGADVQSSGSSRQRNVRPQASCFEDRL